MGVGTRRARPSKFSKSEKIIGPGTEGDVNIKPANKRYYNSLVMQNITFKSGSYKIQKCQFDLAIVGYLRGRLNKY